MSSYVIIDTPKTCRRCPFFIHGNEEKNNPWAHCAVNWWDFSDEELEYIVDNEFPEWCPLMPVPSIPGTPIKGLDK